MAFNGTGTASPPNPPTFPAVSGQVIEAAKFNAIINDIYACLTQVIAKDGQTVITGTLQWANAAANLTALGGVSLSATQTINGTKTFAASPKSLVAAVAAEDLIRKGEFDTAVSTLTSSVNGKAPVAGNAAQAFSVAPSTLGPHAVRQDQFLLEIDPIDTNNWRRVALGTIEFGMVIASTIDGEETFTFPFGGFPTACLDIQLTRMMANGTVAYGIASFTKTQFKIDRDNGLDGTHYVRVRAIGF